MAYLMSAFMVFTWPIGTVVGLVASLMAPFPNRGNRWTRAAFLALIYVGLCALSWGLLAYDPLRVFDWWLD